MTCVSALSADAAVDYLRRRRRLLAGLARVEQALRRWDACETNTLLPADQQRPVRPPALDRPVLDGLDGLERMLTEELARLDGGRRG